MKNVFIFLTTIAIGLLFGKCSNDTILDEKSSTTERSISLIASMPNDEPTTRVSLTQDGKNIILKWQVGDAIELLFKQGTTEIAQTAVVSSISNEGKSAQFDIVMPSGITTGTFDLYGVYGGGGLDASTPSLAILPYPSSSSSLNTPSDFNSVESRKDVMLYFASKNIQTANPQVSTIFKHLGSLFSVTLTNVGNTDYNDLQGGALAGVGGSGDWAYNSLYETNNFDLVNEVFLITQAGANYLLFEPERRTIESGSSITFWGWYPPLPNVVWPELTFEIFDSTGIVEYRTVKTKPARTQPTQPGKSYYFYVAFDGTELKFNAGSIIDERDGNIYQTEAIGNQIWMSENLRYLPSVENSSTTSEVDPHYYVYDYEGYDVDEAKDEENYTIYGVLYNWPAAMGYTLPPSESDVCPEGWHLPSDAEWTELVNYLGGAYEAGAKLKEKGTEHWYDESSGVTNESGFTALPGGALGGAFGSFDGLGEIGIWWRSNDDENGTLPRGLTYGNNIVYRISYEKDYAYSVRCVKD